MKLLRDWDRELQLFLLNEEFLVSAGHQLALITSLPFVHTARRYNRLSNLLRRMDAAVGCFGGLLAAELRLKILLEGCKSRNKVSVGEPAEGSSTQVL